jgi:hypothetical protein
MQANHLRNQFKQRQPLTELIREADFSARDKELREIEYEIKPQDRVEPGELYAGFSAVHTAGDNSEQKTSQAQELDSRLGKQKPHPKPRPNLPQRIDIPWLHAEMLFSRIRPYINAYVTPRGWDISKAETNIWRAFSFKDGIVYVQPGLLSRLAMRVARDLGEPHFIIRCSDHNYRRNVEYSIKSKFRELGFIAETIGTTYTGDRFLVQIKGDKKPLKGYYVPFKAEVFGDLSEMEKTRKGRLADIETVKPFVKKKVVTKKQKHSPQKV